MIRDRKEELLRLHAEHSASGEAARTNGHRPTDAPMSDDQVIALCRKAKNAPKFERLFDRGDASEYGHDDSSADFALVGMLAFYTQDPDQLDGLFRSSALCRRKWTDRADYRRRTIDKALAGQTETYQPPSLNAPGGPESDGTLAAISAEPEEKTDKPTQAQILIECAEGAQLFHAPGGETYATIEVGNHRETHPLKSKGFRRWLVRGYYEAQGRPPGSQAMQDALGLLEARAQFDGAEREVHVRVASHEGALYLDLANGSWDAVEITASGWRVVPASATPVRFRRPRGMLPLPTPAPDGRDGGDGRLRDFINLGPEDDTAYHLIVAWLVQALRPTGPYPVLILQGEQGSAKSTAEKLLRLLVDPSTAPIRTTPRGERDLIISATNSWCVAFDNISSLQPWLSDALCRLATGGGFTARELYQDSEEILFEATRPVILNGITDVAGRPDLLDRAIVVTLPPIPEEKRRPEAELWRDFEAARPRILAYLLDGVSGALRTVAGVKLDGMPRMADFAVWVTAAEGALGWEPGTFMAAYFGNRAEAAEGALEADPVAAAVLAFVGRVHEWAGTPTELWQALNGIADEDVRRTKAWPGAPNALTNRLKRLAPALRGVGIEYGDTREPGGKRRRVKYLKKKVGAKERPRRPDRPVTDELPANSRNGTGTVLDDAGRSRDGERPKTVPQENPANGHIRDDGDGRDDESRHYSGHDREVYSI